jgi:molybdopterin-containing oxidoreductase family iron-sulfur binding subunit
MPPASEIPSGQVGRMWRSLGERDLPSDGRGQPTPEFPLGAEEWPPGIDRREFLRLMGASLALGGLVGCTPPNGTLVPYVTPPEEALPGSPEYYATAVPVEGFARGIVVESHQGRPTKIEGNPEHPDSHGATDAVTQAAILSLYDPDRTRSPRRRGVDQPWAAFEAEWKTRRPALLGARGRGLALLSEPTTSPTFLREVGLFLETFPEAKWYQHTPLAGYDHEGRQPLYDFGQARVVLFIGSDCLFRHPACLRYSRDFARQRRVTGAGGPRSRVYALEASPTLTGAMADFRLPADPERMRVLLDTVVALLDGRPMGAGVRLAGAEADFLSALVRDLRAYAPQVLCVAGPEQEPDVQAWAIGLTMRLSRLGGVLRLGNPVRSDADPRSEGRLERLDAALGAGEVQALFILGSNPAYTSAGFREVAGALGRVPFSVHLGSHADETAALCTWHLPEAHFLEAWDDRRAFDGTVSLLQPLIAPLYQGRSAAEVLHGIAAAAPLDSYALVRETWGGDEGGPVFEERWARWLKRGLIKGSSDFALHGAPPAAAPVPALARPAAGGGLTLLLVPDASVLDGRWSNNAWLQELPRPLTQLVWDNAALVGPALAASLGVVTGDLLRIEHGAAVVEAAAYVLPGQAPNCVTLALGYGRTRAGSVGNLHGFDAYPLRRDDRRWEVGNVQVGKTGGRYALVTTQHHFTMEGRDPVRLVPAGGTLAAPADPAETLYPAEWKAGAVAWGMSIDLNTCLGCNACIVACQAENNIPVVGKDQVARGREMHWIRVDRYFDGDPAAPRILSQPVPCMHCETAPCEVVCPVGATVHSSEGLNEMVYNRCVGTRYCSNNCPYKVRRFNFLDYRSKPDSPVNLQKNPDVTVRARGVMEKCNYCVQRINAARIDAAKADRPIRDGEIKTACQQACPLEAIVFGNVADSASRVSELKRQPASYGLLAELNTRPRTTYLARVTQEYGGTPA